MIKYFVYPDYVRSISDGDVHYITAQQLMKLYDVNPLECKVIRTFDDERGFTDWRDKVIQLWPRADGEYALWRHGEPQENMRLL